MHVQKYLTMVIIVIFDIALHLRYRNAEQENIQTTKWEMCKNHAISTSE